MAPGAHWWRPHRGQSSSRPGYYCTQFNSQGSKPYCTEHARVPEWLLSACMQKRSRQAGDSVPRRQRTPYNADPDSLRLSGRARTCQPGQEACGPFGALLLHGLPLCDPAACSDFAGRAARKGARGSKIGSGSESGLSTRPCRLAGFLRFPHRFTPSGASGASGPSGPLAAQSPRPFYCGLLPTIRPSHTQPRQ